MSSDASAAFGVIQRQGLERPGHVDWNFFFVQSLNARKVMHCAKVMASDHLADICTMDVNAELMTQHVSAVGGRYTAGKPPLCPEVLGILDSVRNSSSTRNSVEQCCLLKYRGATVVQ